LSEELEIFKVQGTDRRREILQTEEPFYAQAVGGKNVEYFSPETGFVLLRKDKRYNPKSTLVQRVKAICDLSLHNPPMGLRDGYYTIRQSPHLIGPFRSTQNIYQAYLQSINHLEIICDVDRATFVEGRTPKGLIFYPHHYTYGNIDKPVGFTENIARHVLKDYEIENCMNIIAIEKLASAVPLAASKFPKLTNSLLVTTGGFYTRGIATIIKRFMDYKTIWLWTDADVWGVYMREVIRLGSMNARHLDDKIRHPNVINAGLKPAVARELGLPNDIEEKRPLEKPESRKRIELLRMVGFPEEDLKVFQDNYTFELEALNVAFRDRDNNPVGQALYLAKLMELLDRPIKPIPDWDAEWLKEQAKHELERITSNKLRDSITFDTELKQAISEAVTEKVQELVEEVISQHLEKVQEKLDLDDDHIKALIYDWYKNHLEKEYIPASVIPKKAFEVNIRSVPKETIEAKVKEFKAKLKEIVKELLEELKLEVDVVTKDVPKPNTTKRDLYRQVYKELKIRPEDERRMEEALKKFLRR